MRSASVGPLKKPRPRVSKRSNSIEPVWILGAPLSSLLNLERNPCKETLGYLSGPWLCALAKCRMAVIDHGDSAVPVIYLYKVERPLAALT